MSQPPVRMRPGAANAAPTPTRNRSAAKPTRAGWMKKGEDIFNTAEAEAAKAEERKELRKAGLTNVQRFWLKAGEEAHVIVLDESLESVRGLYEHQLKDSKGHWRIHETCVKEFANCPVCDRHDDSYYAMFLTILDLRGYDKKDEHGKVIEHIPHVRQLLPIKSGQIAKWRGMIESAIEETGTLRGTYIVLRRAKGEKTSNIGEPVILKGGKVYDTTTEEELVESYGHDEVLGQRDGAVIKAANADITPYDYDKLFPEPDVEDLRRRYGGEAEAGSPEEVVREFGEREKAGGSVRTRPRPATAAPAAEETRVRRRPAPTHVEEEVLDEAPEPTGDEEPFEE